MKVGFGVDECVVLLSVRLVQVIQPAEAACQWTDGLDLIGTQPTTSTGGLAGGTNTSLTMSAPISRTLLCKSEPSLQLLIPR